MCSLNILSKSSHLSVIDKPMPMGDIVSAIRPIRQEHGELMMVPRHTWVYHCQQHDHKCEHYASHVPTCTQLPLTTSITIRPARNRFAWVAKPCGVLTSWRIQQDWLHMTGVPHGWYGERMRETWRPFFNVLLGTYCTSDQVEYVIGSHRWMLAYCCCF